MSLPYPGMTFSGLSSEDDLNKIGENLLALEDGSGLDSNAIDNASIQAGTIDEDVASYEAAGFVEIGRTTLTSAADIMSVTFTPRTFLIVEYFITTTGGTANQRIRFNGDTNANYSWRHSTNDAADSAISSTASIYIDAVGAVAQPLTGTFFYVNVADQEKLGLGHVLVTGAAGAGNNVSRREVVHKWANASTQINRIDIDNASGTGDFAIGSQIVVMGIDLS